MICGSVPITTSDIPWEELNEFSVGFSLKEKIYQESKILKSTMENSKYIDLSNRTKKYAEQNYHAEKVTQKLVDYFLSIEKATTMKNNDLTIVIITLNEAHNLDRFFESIEGWVSNVVVLDSLVQTILLIFVFLEVQKYFKENLIILVLNGMLL